MHLNMCCSLLKIFFSLRQGGMSSGFKKKIADKDGKDATYTFDGIALFRVSGSSVHNNKVLQVDVVS